jgi:uncharacterized protein (DUF983 family)
MLKKGSKLNSILTGSCPRCQEESMYKGKNPYNPSETIKLNEKCNHCGLHYTIEPSFFYGAMYVSYGLGVGIGVASFVITNLLLGYGLKIAFFSIGVALVMLMPLIMRISRNIWINIFVSYDKDWKDNI